MNTKELRKLAEAATPGEWEAESALVWEREGLSIATTHNSKCYENAAYIAAASPTVIIEILDRLDAIGRIISATGAGFDDHCKCPLCRIKAALKETP